MTLAPNFRHGNPWSALYALDFSRSFMGIGDREPTITWSVDCSHGFTSIGAAFSRVGLRWLSWNASKCDVFALLYLSL